MVACIARKRDSFTSPLEKGCPCLASPAKQSLSRHFFAQVAYSIKFPGNERRGSWDNKAGEEGKLSQGCPAVLGEWWTGAACCRGPAEQSCPPEPRKGNVSPPACVLWVKCCPGGCELPPVHLKARTRGHQGSRTSGWEPRGRG